MNIKKHTLYSFGLYIGIIALSVLFGYKVNAAVNYMNTMAAPDDLCYYETGGTATTSTCPLTNPNAGGFQVIQELELDCNDEPMISDAWLYVDTVDSGGTLKATLRDLGTPINTHYDGTPYEWYWNYTGGTDYEDSNTISITEGINKVEFNNFIVNCSNHVNAIVWTLSAGNSIQITYGDQYPSGNGYDYQLMQASGYHNLLDTGHDPYLSADARMLLSGSYTKLSIEKPEYLQIVEEPFEFYGGCSNDVNYVFYNYPTEEYSTNAIASSTTAVYGNLTCGSSNLYQGFFTFGNGWWNVMASSTATSTQDANTRFYITDTDVDYADIGFGIDDWKDDYGNMVTGWSCDMPILGDPCFAAQSIFNQVASSTVEKLIEQYAKLQGTKPIKYVYDIKETFDGYDDIATSTFPGISLSVASSSSPYINNIDLDLFSMAQLEAQFPSEKFTAVRTISLAIVYIVFIMYLYRRFINIV